MKILIAYATRYGTTEKCANILADLLVKKSHEVELVNLKKNTKVKPDDFDIVAIGGSIVAFRMNSAVKKFVKRNLNTLIEMKTGIFICGANENLDELLKKGYPEQLIEKAAAKGHFGFEMNWERMNKITRGMMQKASKTTDPISKIKNDNIIEFSEDILK